MVVTTWYLRDVYSKSFVLKCNYSLSTTIFLFYRTMTGRINPCSRCLIEKCIISKVDDDPRDEIINTVRTLSLLILWPFDCHL